MTNDETVEAIARVINPGAWQVMDAELACTLKKYKGESIGYNPDDFKHNPSMARASEILSIITALDWLPPEAQASIERAALERAAEVCMSEALDWETRHGNPCKRLAATILALIPTTKEPKS